jgi:hypothetical protein
MQDMAYRLSAAAAAVSPELPGVNILAQVFQHAAARLAEKAQQRHPNPNQQQWERSREEEEEEDCAAVCGCRSTGQERPKKSA